MAWVPFSTLRRVNANLRAKLGRERSRAANPQGGRGFIAAGEPGANSRATVLTLPCSAGGFSSSSWWIDFGVLYLGGACILLAGLCFLVFAVVALVGL